MQPCKTATPNDGQIYVFQAGENGPVKIGITTEGRVRRRLQNLQIGNPVKLRIVMTFPGSAEKERELHSQFAAHRMRGEWFSADVIQLLPAFSPPAFTYRGFGTNETNKTSHFIRLHGGTKKVADRLGKSQSTVSTWIKRQHIPVWNWPDFVKIGVAWEEILSLHKPEEVVA